MRIISWNLLRRTGASLDDVAALARQERPDLLLMQEATDEIDALPTRLGGHYARRRSC
jgi:endonuclease/exonuclease/phosphatase (EEP) superfamily protein YafD